MISSVDPANTEAMMKLFLVLCVVTVITVAHTAPCGPLQYCEPVRADLCTGLDNNYNQTKFPTKRFISQDDALLQFTSYSALVQSKCSTMLASFLCGYYFPPCLQTTGNCAKDNSFELEPCQDLCTEVQRTCEPVLKSHNLTWNFDCGKFPPKQPCIAGPTASDPIVPSIDMCHPVNNSVCGSLHSSYMTIFPNDNFDTEEDADLHFLSFEPIINNTCSDQLKFLLCSTHYPVCIPDVKDSSKMNTYYPCKSVCRQVRINCEHLLIANNASWPDLLDCDNFTSKKDNDGICIEEVNIKPKCEPIDSRVYNVCHVLDKNYTLTHFPHGNFKTQSDAYKVFESHLKNFSGNCSPELLALLCYHYFPSCSLDEEEPKVPCRSVCRKARNGCEECFKQKNKNLEWPEEFECGNYSVNKSCITLKDIDDYLKTYDDSQTCKSE